MFWIIILAFVMLMALAIVIYMLPSDPAPKQKKKEKKERIVPDAAVKPAQPEKDWKSIAERWEKQNNGLIGDIEKLKMQEKKILKETEDHKAQNTELLDKLALEKSWREKEQVNLDKSRHHEKDLKEQIFRTEKDLEKEHSNRLRAERDFQELKIKHDVVVEEKRESSTKAMSLETTLNVANKELKELRAENAKLKEKREDIQWVSKAEFDAMQREYNLLKARGGIS